MGAVATPEGSIAVAIAALLLVLGFRLARPERGVEWLAVAGYAAALAVQVFGAQGLLPGRAAEPPLAVRIAGAALLVVGILVAGGPARARRRARSIATSTATPTPQPSFALSVAPPQAARSRRATPTSTPTYAGLALVVLGQLLRGPSTAGAVATLVAILVNGWAALALARRVR